MPSQHSDTRKPWGPGGALGQLQHLWLSGMGQHSWSLIPSLSMLRELIVHDFRVLPITAGSWTTEAAVKTDRRTGEPIVLDLAHSPAVYQMRYRFRSGYLLWRYPREAWAALREVMPWEALAVSLCVCLAVGIRFGQDLGVTAGVCMSLALVTVQLLRTRAFATPSRIVRERGLLVMSRSEIDVASISDGRIEYPEGTRDSFGDIVLVTSQGATRLWAVGSGSSSRSTTGAPRRQTNCAKSVNGGASEQMDIADERAARLDAARS
jgi:hypothetical protein